MCNCVRVDVCLCMCVPVYACVNVFVCFILCVHNCTCVSMFVCAGVCLCVSVFCVFMSVDSVASRMYVIIGDCKTKCICVKSFLNISVFKTLRF